MQKKVSSYRSGNILSLDLVSCRLQDMDMSAVPTELTRREREAIEAQRKKDNYMKLHAEGKTEEAQVNSPPTESPLKLLAM